MEKPILLQEHQMAGRRFVIAPSQFESIAANVGDMMADAMDMRVYVGKFRRIAREALLKSLEAASTSGAK